MRRPWSAKHIVAAICFCSFICTTKPLCADSFTFATLPSGGNILGSAGATVGWGYSITNKSVSDWLLTTNLVADPFLNGSPSLLFDFPVIAPGQTMTEAFNAGTGSGLYEFTWDATAPQGFTNAGDFTLSAQWWDGDPFNGGTYIADTPDVNVPYSATVSSTPEPSTWLLLLLAGSVFRVFRRTLIH